MRKALIPLALAAALLAPAGPATADEIPPMTTEQAAARYMTYMCPYNAAMDRFAKTYRRYDRKDDTGDRPHKKTRAAAKKASTVSRVGAVAYMDPASPWPDEVADDVEQIALSMYEDAAMYRRISRTKFRWPSEMSWGADIGDYATSVRLRLGLPPRGEGC